MTEFLGTEHREITCGYSEIAKTFPQVLWHAETPVVRVAPVPMFLLSRLVRDSSYKVVLTGEGADEILAGYDLFKEAKVRRFMEAFPDSRFRSRLLLRLYPYLQMSPTRSLEYAKAFFGAPIEPFPREFHSHATRWNMTSGIRKFFSPALREEIASSRAADRVALLFADPVRTNRPDPLTLSQEIEIKTLLPGYLLSSQGDRMLMGNSVEGRFPFLDHRVVEFALGIPPHMRMNGLTEKYVLRKSMSGLLPKEIMRMEKQPYRAPDARCFFEKGAGDTAEAMLSPEFIARNGYFDPISTERLAAKCRGNPKIGFKDNMAFIGILSTQILDQLYLRDFQAREEIPAERVRVSRWNQPA